MPLVKLTKPNLADTGILILVVSETQENEKDRLK